MSAGVEPASGEVEAGNFLLGQAPSTERLKGPLLAFRERRVEVTQSLGQTDHHTRGHLLVGVSHLLPAPVRQPLSPVHPGTRSMRYRTGRYSALTAGAFFRAATH